ncbi:MAG: BatA domain-containing protein [Ignavibacteriae bacterium]|nr:BatA domain-containing protein [Ignavibacteriota bacterium]
MFLNPYILFALSAISVPILIHLFNLRKVRRQEFSTLMFLKEIQKTKLRRLRLQRLLLLALRILIIIFIVLAFADPIFRGYTQGKGENLTKLSIVFIDDSFSMSARSARGELFSVAKEELKQIDKLYSSSDKLYIIRTSSLTAPEYSTLRDTKNPSVNTDTSAGVSDAVFDISPAIRKAQEIISENAYPVNEIFIISDFQKINFSPPRSSVSQTFDNTADFRQSSSYLYLLNLGHRVPNNISINAIDIKTKLIEPSREIKLTAALKNFNNYNVTGKQINLYIEGQKISEMYADLAPYERKEIEFSFKPSKPGLVNGYAELVQANYQDDEIAKDNRFSFNLFVPEEYSVGIYSPTAEASRYIRTVLGLSPVYKIKTISSLADLTAGSPTGTPTGSPTGTPTGSPTGTPTGSLSGSEDQTGMIFIAGKTSFSVDEINAVSDYLKQGRGVFIFPPVNADVKSYNELLSKLGGFKLTEKINGKSAVNPLLSSGGKFSSLDFQHPVLEGIFRDKSLTATDFSPDIDAPEIYSIYPSLAGISTSVLMTMKDNVPFLLETKTPGSPLLFCAVSADMQMSDFPKNPLFAPVITKSVAYLTSAFNGHAYTNKQNAISNHEAYLTSAFSGHTYNNKQNAILNHDTYLTSAFNVHAYTNKQNAILNHDTLESNLLLASASEITDYFKQSGLKNVQIITNPGTELAGIVAENRTGTSLWYWFIISAVILTFLEMYYSKKLST